MAAYLIVDSDITDEALFAQFTGRIVQVVESHGGKYLARGGATQVVGGTRAPHRVVIIEFESVEQVQTMVSSPDYQELAEIRDNSSDSSTILVEGL